MATVWGLPPGDWATWVGSIFVGLSFAFLAYGTIRQAKETGRQASLDASAQARDVGGWIIFGEASPDGSGDTIVELFVQNSSPLPVRRVHGYLFAAEDRLSLIHI